MIRKCRIMKRINEEEFKEYLEYKRFMGEKPGESARTSGRKLNLEELDQVRAASGKRDFDLFLREMQARSEEEE